MSERVDQVRSHLLPGLTYFEYQRIVARDIVIPWLARRVDLSGFVVGDFGAHHGGMVDAFRDSSLVHAAVGLELSAEAVASSPFAPDDRFRLEVADVMALPHGRYEFDLVVLHDVLEHIPDYETALRAVAGSLRRGGKVFISFPPYYSAFGGHQQLARGRARLVPFVHLLPSKVFLGLAEPGENEYMSTEGSLEDLLSVRRTKLTLGRAEDAFRQVSFQMLDRELFLVRPEYRVRYGLRERRAGLLGAIPGVREVAVNGAFYLLGLKPP